MATGADVGDTPPHRESSSEAEIISVDGTDITISDVGPEFSYTVPSFSVLTVYLRQASMQLEQAGSLHCIQGFIRSDPMLDRIFGPFKLTVTHHCLVDVSLQS